MFFRGTAGLYNFTLMNPSSVCSINFILPTVAAAFIGEAEEEFKSSRDKRRGFGALPQLKKEAACE